ncbi:hypothetical protein TNIN_385721 [Trichonephila inaurata madagascariensis]|uniref:Uncharacterized protein n=1 Tax=Trichonephila inaurata madagascariensis TaxID=2747483 RepID=A0A8X6Y0L2_9ARAC|nr:hypothetical protein TNIN_385721 [Trichonephila inaurata madagascariensis]
MVATHQDPLEQYLDSHVPELKEETPSRVTDVGLLESSQIITALSTVINQYIERKVIPTEFLVLPEAKGK